MLGKLKAGIAANRVWSEWAPVLQQLPSQAVEGVQNAAAAGRSALGRKKNSSNSSGSSADAGGSVSAARISATSRTGAHASPSGAAAASAAAAATAANSSDATANAAPGALSKLASGLKEGWRAKVGGAAAAAPPGSSRREEEREQRSFLLSPSSDSTATKSIGGGDAFNFDDEDPDDNLDEPSFSLTPGASSSMHSSRASASAASASVAARSSAAISAPSHDRPPAASSAASLSNADASRLASALGAPSDSTSDPTAAFATLPKLSVQGRALPSSSASAAPPIRSSDAFVQSQALAAREVEAAQEDMLEDMSHAIARLQGIGLEINKQLVVQNGMLTELGEQIDEGESHFERLDRKMAKLLNRSSLPHWKIIFCLLGLMIFLLLILFYF
jgi:uncharacterized coiled-coil protein SlyX